MLLSFCPVFYFFFLSRPLLPAFTCTMTSEFASLLLVLALCFTQGLAQFPPHLTSSPHHRGPHIGSPDHEPTSRIGPLQPSIEATTTPATTAKPAVAERVGRIDTGDSDPNKEADAVLKLLRNSKNRQGVQAIDLKMGCFTESPDTLSSDSAEKATGEGGSTGGLSRPGLQSLLMQVVGQVASYNERMTQETDNRKAIVKMLESYIKSQRDSLKRSETILNEYRVSLPKLS